MKKFTYHYTKDYYKFIAKVIAIAELIVGFFILGTDFILFCGGENRAAVKLFFGIVKISLVVCPIGTGLFIVYRKWSSEKFVNSQIPFLNCEVYQLISCERNTEVLTTDRGFVREQTFYRNKLKSLSDDHIIEFTSRSAYKVEEYIRCYTIQGKQYFEQLDDTKLFSSEKPEV